eukprot:2378802-Rhodomonas_salina.2
MPRSWYKVYGDGGLVPLMWTGGWVRLVNSHDVTWGDGLRVVGVAQPVVVFLRNRHSISA